MMGTIRGRTLQDGGYHYREVTIKGKLLEGGYY